MGKEAEMRMKEEVRALWKYCFNDSDEFMDLYFGMRYKEEINRTLVKDGRVISALQAIPYLMTCYGHVVNMAYISGACTHPDFRAHGAMKRLLKETHRRMYEEGFCLSTLIPAEAWLRDYYARSGYAVCFYYEETYLSTSCLGTFDEECEVTLCRGAEANTYPYFQKMMCQRSNCVQHTWDDYRVILADLRLGGGMVFVAHRKGEMVGIAFCVEENGLPIVKEMCFNTPVVKDMLCQKILSVYGTKRLAYIHEAGNSACPLGMARVISVKKMLTLYAVAHPEEVFCCHLENDEAIPENNGYYVLQQGKCVEGMFPDKVYEEHTIGSLTQKLFYLESPYMSLMLN